MNLSTDIIFRLILTIVMTVVVVRMLWFIIKNYLERSSSKTGKEEDLDTLIEQQKRLLALSGSAPDDESRAYITELQWGEESSLQPIVQIFETELAFTPSFQLIKKAALPLNRHLAKNSPLKFCHKAQLINILCILVLHLENEEIKKALPLLNLQPVDDPIKVAQENKDLKLSVYLAKIAGLPQS